jgi:hypothetical protein
MLKIDLQILGWIVQIKVKSPVVFARIDAPLDGSFNTFTPENIMDEESEKNEGPSDTLDTVVARTPFEILLLTNSGSTF